MPFEDPMSVKRDHEEHYFRKHDEHLIERMRQASRAQAERRAIGEKTGLQDPELVSEIQELGFTAETVSLLPLVPLLEVAWAEAGVSAPERTLLLGFARQRGVADGSAADEQLRAWLDERPSAAMFAKANRLTSALLAAHGAGDLDANDVVKQCEAIAAASGGVFGIGKVSAEERAALAQVAAALKQRR